MDVQISQFKGRPARVDPKTMTGAATVTEAGQIRVRLDDAANDEFWLEFAFPVPTVTVPDDADEEAA